MRGAKNRFSKALNRRGFALIEVMMAAGVLAIISFAVAQLITNIMTGQVRSQQIENINELKLLVTNAIRTDGGCLNTLNGMVIPTSAPANAAGPLQVTSIRDAGNNIIINGAGGGVPFNGSFPEVGGGVAALTNITFQFFSTSPNLDNTSKNAWLRVNYTKRFMNGSTTADYKDLPVIVVPVANKVVRCYGAGSQEFCSAVGGNYDAASGLCDKIDLTKTVAPSTGDIITIGNLITTKGRVGIGTVPPVVPSDYLHISGPPIMANQNGGGIVDIKGGQASLMLRGDSDANRTYSAMYLIAGSGAAVNSNSWVLAHKATGDTPNKGFKISKWSGGTEYTGLALTNPNPLAPVPIFVGIGTATPQYPLDINNGNSVGPAQRLISSATDTWMLLDNTAGGGIGWELISSGAGTSSPGKAGSFAIQRAQNHIMGDLIPFTINSAGNVLMGLGSTKVGVGTVTPAVAFNVYGTSQFDGAGPDKVIINLPTIISQPTTINNNLSVNGSVTVTGTVTASSDLRLKKDITPLEDMLAKIMDLRAVSYTWKDPKAEKGSQLGFIAQEIEKIFPELVRTDVKGHKSVAYQNLIAPLIAAFQELVHRFDSAEERHQREIAELRAENAELREVVCELKPHAKICLKAQTQSAQPQ